MKIVRIAYTEMTTIKISRVTKRAATQTIDLSSTTTRARTKKMAITR